jgi:uncharacterized protein
MYRKIDHETDLFDMMTIQETAAKLIREKALPLMDKAYALAPEKGEVVHGKIILHRALDHEKDVEYFKQEISRLVKEGKINGDLKKLAQKTGQEVRFVVIRRLDFDETMPGFTEKLFQRWYPTPEEQANQTLVVIDTLTNGTALYRGVAAQSLVNDEVAESITNETIAVPLKNGGKYNQAVLEADKRLTALLSGQADPGPPTLQEINLEGTFATAEETDDKSATFWVIVLLALATLIPMATYFWYVGIPGR